MRGGEPLNRFKVLSRAKGKVSDNVCVVHVDKVAACDAQRKSEGLRAFAQSLSTAGLGANSIQNLVQLNHAGFPVVSIGALTSSSTTAVPLATKNNIDLP